MLQSDILKGKEEHQRLNTVIAKQEKIEE